MKSNEEKACNIIYPRYAHFIPTIEDLEDCCRAVLMKLLYSSVYTISFDKIQKEELRADAESLAVEYEQQSRTAIKLNPTGEENANANFLWVYSI